MQKECNLIRRLANLTTDYYFTFIKAIYCRLNVE